MHIIAPAAIVRPYRLTRLNYQHLPVHVLAFATLAELARTAAAEAYTLERNRESWFPREADAVRQVATSARGKLLDMAELVAWGQRLRWSGYRTGRYGNYVFRSGPVTGTRKWRGGSSTRNCQTQGERRGTALVLREDGEVPARAVRCDSYLPSSWDGRRRIVQRCWKSQHKGCKSWDRPARPGKGGNA